VHFRLCSEATVFDGQVSLPFSLLCLEDKRDHPEYRVAPISSHITSSVRIRSEVLYDSVVHPNEGRSSQLLQVPDLAAEGEGGSPLPRLEYSGFKVLELWQRLNLQAVADLVHPHFRVSLHHKFHLKE